MYNVVLSRAHWWWVCQEILKCLVWPFVLNAALPWEKILYRKAPVASSTSKYQFSWKSPSQRGLPWANGHGIATLVVQSTKGLKALSKLVTLQAFSSTEWVLSFGWGIVFLAKWLHRYYSKEARAIWVWLPNWGWCSLIPPIMIQSSR